MKWWERKKKAQSTQVRLSQSQRGPGLGMELYGAAQTQRYRRVREAVPVVDAAIWKLVRLCGGVRAVARDERAQERLDRFWKEVEVGYGQRGVQAFLDRHLDDMFTCGRGVGLMELEQDPLDEWKTDFARLIPLDPDRVSVEWEDGKMACRVYEGRGGGWRTLEGEGILFTPFQPTAQHPWGASMLRGMPDLADILEQIFYATGRNWERAGDIRYALVCKPGEDEGANQERCRQLAEQWSRAMQSTRNGAVQDLVAMGELDIKVIGSDSPVLDSQVPVRQILEQLVARTGIPPFMLGLCWSTTERMSAQQADILTSEITAIRRSVEPALRRLAQTWLHLEGFDDWVEIQWEDINLQDAVEEARAGLYQAQAEKLRGEE